MPDILQYSDSATMLDRYALRMGPYQVYDLPFLRANAKPWVRPPVGKQVEGIYFLLCRGSVVYVGQSQRCCHIRIRRHQLDDLKFDACYIQHVRDWDMLTPLEIEYIARFQPKYNKLYKRRREYQIV